MGTSRDLRALYMDTELECWASTPPHAPQIIQLGIVEADLTSLKVNRRRTFYIRPDSEWEISAYCTHLTHITEEQIRKQGRPLVDVLRTIVNEWGPLNKVCLTWGDDRVAIEEEVGCLNPFVHMIDLGHLFRMTYGIKKGVALRKACEAMGLTFRGREHDAGDDAYMTAQLHLQMLSWARENGPLVNAEHRLV